MREDLTGFAIGGNKNRKLDFLIGDAISKNMDTLITKRATSFSRNAAAAGRVFGFDFHVIVYGEENEQNSASMKLFDQVDAVLHFVPGNNENDLDDKYMEVLKLLKDKGKLVYELHPGGSDSIGTLGYINAFNQVIQYSHNSGIHFHKIIHSTGSTATQVGLLLGKDIGNYDTSIIGMASNKKSIVQKENIRELGFVTAGMLGIKFDENSIIVEDRFIGPGYSIPSEDGEKASKLFAIKEGVLLDYVYTGKAAAGLIHYAKTGEFKNHENVLFIHTGGNAGLFY